MARKRTSVEAIGHTAHGKQVPADTLALRRAKAEKIQRRVKCFVDSERLPSVEDRIERARVPEMHMQVLRQSNASFRPRESADGRLLTDREEHKP